MITAHDIAAALWFFTPAFLANMAPVLAKGHFEVLARPVDAGLCLRGRRVFGDHKTWRGMIAAVVVAAVVYELQRGLYEAGIGRDLASFDYTAAPLLPGLLLGAGTGIGDAVKSFFKRQVGIAPGASWFPFDQIDFLIGAALAVSLVQPPPPLLTMLGICPIVIAGGVVTSAIGYRLKLKDAWI